MKICYFNLVEKIHTRDSVYLNGLRKLGVEIAECKDSTPGLGKFWNLYKKHRALKNNYDVLLVGFSGHILVPFAKIISRKKVVFNAMSSLYDGAFWSHKKKYGFLGWRIPYIWLLDFSVFHCAYLSIFDSEHRKEYIRRTFLVPGKKLASLCNGVDDSIFVYNPNVKKLSTFTVLFRGAFMTEAGIEYLLEAADILKSEQIKFRIIGSGQLSPIVEKMIKELKSTNVEWIKERLPWEELVLKMQECHISIGQNSTNKRQKVQVAFKTAESMALKIPYVVASNSEGILEFLTDEETCVVAKYADSRDLAEKILWAKNNPAELDQIAENAYQLFKEKFTTEKLSLQLKNILQKYL